MLMTYPEDMHFSKSYLLSGQNPVLEWPDRSVSITGLRDRKAISIYERDDCGLLKSHGFSWKAFHRRNLRKAPACVCCCLKCLWTTRYVSSGLNGGFYLSQKGKKRFLLASSSYHLLADCEARAAFGRKNYALEIDLGFSSSSGTKDIECVEHYQRRHFLLLFILLGDCSLHRLRRCCFNAIHLLWSIPQQNVLHLRITGHRFEYRVAACLAVIERDDTMAIVVTENRIM
ncbi:hypothetical protein CEXT_176871 [Caerostris extrusa]|uniref:Uncharacterized protein n=1 Tax=Caerostris extrusa TaxID=172846 RepID=A0AAV4XWB8_CAEEX|nr:hypothetical protein CEXT_176871 [Caerostris extrusa]